MFTGLIEEKGKIVQIERGPAGLKLTINAPEISGDVSIGDSVSVNGACLTAVAVNPPNITFDVVRETVERSNLGSLKVGNSVNLERPLKAGARLGGHIVLGHIDGKGIIREIHKDKSSTSIRIQAPPNVMQYIVEKGSIAVDGISLTVAECGKDWFAVAIIPHTWKATTLSEKTIGDTINLETDIIGKYVHKFLSGNIPASDERLINLLSEGGFME
ncbi:MAG: riboflavin synthase [Armatimonadetes bacterium]|nr:riboflavin synthase [Armatimonadota bacterium]